LQIYSINVISIEAELMAIHTDLIPTMERDNIHDIIVITDSIAAARKILESKVDVRLANFKARIKPTAPLLVFDKENSIEFSLDFSTLFIQLLHCKGTSSVT